jgi:hypothetical protein
MTRPGLPPQALPVGPTRHRLEPTHVGGAPLLKHPASGVLFLPGHPGFRLDEVYRYDEAGQNVSARYAAGPAALVSVYVFPSDSLCSSQAFGAIFDAAVRDMLASLASHCWAHDRETAFAHASGEVVSGRRVEVAGHAQGGDDRPQGALVELFERGRWMLKVRATYQPALRAEVEGFLSAWLAASTFGGRAPGVITRRQVAG